MKQKVYLICDESGAKGYSDKQENYPGEIGVMAGFIVSLKKIDKIRCDLNVIKNKITVSGKLHITDLSPSEQNNLRDHVFDYIIKNNIPCVYEAIHSQGFYGHSKSLVNLKDEIITHKKSKISTSTHHNKSLLHQQLFQGIFGKATAFSLEYVGNEIGIFVITDKSEETVNNKFIVAANSFLDLGLASRKEVQGFDHQQKKIVEGEIHIHYTDPSGIIDDLSNFSFSLQSEDSCLTLAADIIANSLHYHFRERAKKSIGKSLNTATAIRGHPLEKYMYGIWGTSKLSYYADAVFKHPSTIISLKQ